MGRVSEFVFPTSVQTSNPRLGASLLNALTSVLTARHADEDEFDKALFAAMYGATEQQHR